MKKRFLLGSTLALSTFATATLASEPVVSEQVVSKPVVSDLVAPIASPSEAASPYSTFQIVQTEEAEAQVTSVSQLSDVQPTDWAFQALQSLVERYGCIAGYPDGTFRGNRAATRYELAAALNACLDQISDRFATKEDLETVKALQEEFRAELATLKGRVDGLEARTATLEAQQFSTTTKLVGEAIFQPSIGNNVTPALSGNLAGFSLTPTGDNATFLHRATLTLLTSFTGKDLLVTSLQEGSYPVIGLGNVFNQPNFSSSHGGLAPSYNQSSSGALSLYYLGYRFPVFEDKGTVFITAVGGELSDFTDTLNPYFDSDGQGALSGFGIRNPIYRHISGRTTGLSSGTGVGANFNINDQLNLAIGYLAPNILAGQASVGVPASGPFAFGGDNGGLFGGDFSAIAQLTYKPTKTLGFGLTYVRTYQNSILTQLGGGSGTFRASLPFLDTPASADSAGLQFSWQPSSRFGVSGWFGATFATAKASNGIFVADGNKATILNGAIALAFPDLFIPGNLGGIIFGVEPTVTSNTSLFGTDPDTNFHIEALYRVKINDNISITPGVIAIINPEGNSSNDPIFLGTIRTTFTF